MDGWAAILVSLVVFVSEVPWSVCVQENRSRMTIMRQTDRKKEWELCVASGQKDVRDEAAKDTGTRLINTCITGAMKQYFAVMS